MMVYILIGVLLLVLTEVVCPGDAAAYKETGYIYKLTGTWVAILGWPLFLPQFLQDIAERVRTW